MMKKKPARTFSIIILDCHLKLRKLIKKQIYINISGAITQENEGCLVIMNVLGLFPK